MPDKFEPFPKNPTLAKFFVQLGRAEELGTGIRRVFQYINAYSGSSDVVFKEEDIFTVEVPLIKDKESNGELTSELTSELTGELNEGQRTVFILIKNNGGIQAGEISKKINMPFSTVDKHVRVLLKKKLIERRGSKKTGGYWALV